MNWIAELSSPPMVAEQGKIILDRTKYNATKPTKLKSIKLQLKPCPICEGRDFVNGTQGGYFCKNCQPGIEGTSVKAGGTMLETDIKGYDCDWCTPEDEHHFSIRKPRKKLSASFMAAHKWFVEHRQELRTVGWTSVHLYRRNGNKGIAWLRIWDNPGLEIFINDAGQVTFRFRNATGLFVIQTAFPTGRRKLRSQQLDRPHSVESER